MYLFLAFLAVPVIEIALFIQVGSAIGLWPTLAIVILTAVLGTWLVRTQGKMAIARLGRSFQELNDPTQPLADGAMILIAGVLLLTPGFFTDALGFALLMPPVRLAVFNFLRKRVNVVNFQMGPTPRGFDRSDVIDGDFEEVRSSRDPEPRPSGWVDGPNRH